MLYGDPHKILSEAASADLLDPEVDQEVKDVVNDLQDTLTTNVEEVPAGDKETNNAVLSPEELKECCTIWENNGRYFADIRDIMRICEAEEEATGEPADAGEVAADVADANDVPTDDNGDSELVIVAPSDVATEMIEAALNEAKCGKKGKATKKAKGLGDALKSLKKKGFKIARVDKKKK